MPFCPNCKTEYREGFDTCADCGAPLADDLPAQAPPGEAAYAEPVLLATLSGGMEAGAAEGLLREAGIPVYCKNAASHRPTVITGLTGYVEFYVPADRLEEARDTLYALAALAPDAPEAEPGAEPDSDALLDDRPAHTLRKIVVWVALILFALAVLFGVFPNIIF